MSKTDANKRHTAEFYRRKCHDLAIENKRLRETLGQLNEIVDGTLVQVAKRYGKKVRERGKVIGWRIQIPIPDLDGCTVRTERRDGEYLVGVIAPEEKEEK